MTKSEAIEALANDAAKLDAARRSATVEHVRKVSARGQTLWVSPSKLKPVGATSPGAIALCPADLELLASKIEAAR